MMKLRTSLYVMAMALLWGCKEKPPEEKNIDQPYKHWLIYNLDVKTFQDSNNDGEGDFAGVTSHLNYLQFLGINTIWLAPFQPSPQQDDGYDISDYYAIDPKLGSMADFKQFLTEARKRHFNVIMDIVLNHSSIRHPWFRSKPDWYLWSKQRPADWDKGMGFPGVEKDSWHFDDSSKAYYFHRFYSFQPDLNYQNPQVIREAEKIMAYWLDQGLDGFRLDAVPFIIDDPRKNSEKPLYDFNILHELTGFVQHHKPGSVLLGEANVEPEENAKYFTGHHPGLNMMFNFYANQYLFYGLATGDADRFKEALKKTKAKPGIAQWAWFLRNHDEIDLGRLSHHELNEVYQKMGPDTNMQLYKRGIRRRLATMLGGNPKQLRMAYSLLYSLPGTPVIRQGEEIGMGDDLKLKERLAIRTPMQWDTTLNGGFTRGVPFRPVITSVEYGYETVDVSKEQADAQSLLRFIRQLIRLRMQYPEIDNGEWRVLETSKEILAILYTEGSKQVMMVHNFSEKEQMFKYGNTSFTLKSYDFKWLRLK
jgi:maltose alpha-D-glucosyltransferase/alpha-amylase